MTYANFWKRVGAFLIDGIILSAITSALGKVLASIPFFNQKLMFAILPLVQKKQITTQELMPLLQVITWIALVSLVMQLICAFTYYVLPEGSAWQATLGKRLLGLKVTDLAGQRISVSRSFGRNLGKICSALILGIGYLMCLWTEKRQCLHDMMAGCLVFDTHQQEKQGWGKGLLIIAIGPAICLIGLLILRLVLPE